MAGANRSGPRRSVSRSDSRAVTGGVRLSSEGCHREANSATTGRATGTSSTAGILGTALELHPATVRDSPGQGL